MAPAVSPRVLVLWDIDHTLIETRGVGLAIYRRAFAAATGNELGQLAKVAGRTELDIMSETLRINGHNPTDDAVNRLAAALVQGYEDARDELQAVGRALPGARAALTLLAAEPEVHQSVLTGNLRQVARIKLEVFDLASYLDLGSGAYGEDDHNRAELVELARQRAHELTGVAFAGRRTVLIGDTPNDVRAGRAAGAYVIAVTSGKSSIDELTAAGADHVLANLTSGSELHQRLTQDVV